MLRRTAGFCECARGRDLKDTRRGTDVERVDGKWPEETRLRAKKEDDLFEEEDCME
jgi:hypothetical protein